MYDRATPIGHVPGRVADTELDAFIDRRVRQAENDRDPDAPKPDELVALTREQDEDRRRVNKELWRRYHLSQAERLRRLLSEQIALHEEQAERYASMTA
jgi:hypothetical protein